MEGWQLPLAPEQAFSLALSQERVGVMRFATPSDAMTMNFNAVALGAAGLPGPPGALEPFVDVDAIVSSTLFM